MTAAFATTGSIKRADFRVQRHRSRHPRRTTSVVYPPGKYEASLLKLASSSSSSLLWMAIPHPPEITMTSSLQLLDPSDVSSASTKFEPILNVPALMVFVLIMGIFLLLQRRVSAIEAAAEERTLALQRLRTVKSAELSDATLASSEQVQLALRDYEVAYNRVEQLRTIVPGVRVIPPPSQSLTQERQRENEAAAKQFLGIEQPKLVEPLAKTEQGMSPFLATVLILIAFSQIALLVLLITTDPMVSSTQWNSL